jgi:hypothetical protein
MHAYESGKEDAGVYKDIQDSLAFIAGPCTVDALVGEALKVGATNVNVLALLSNAHMSAYGTPTPVAVNHSPTKGKAILVSGHDFADLLELLKQTEGKGINVVRTHARAPPMLLPPPPMLLPPPPPLCTCGYCARLWWLALAASTWCMGVRARCMRACCVKRELVCACAREVFLPVCAGMEVCVCVRVCACVCVCVVVCALGHAALCRSTRTARCSPRTATRASRASTRTWLATTAAPGSSRSLTSPSSRAPSSSRPTAS